MGGRFGLADHQDWRSPSENDSDVPVDSHSGSGNRRGNEDQQTSHNPLIHSDLLGLGHSEDRTAPEVRRNDPAERLGWYRVNDAALGGPQPSGGFGKCPILHVLSGRGGGVAKALMRRISSECCSRPSRVPVVIPGLGSRADESSARGYRGGAGARGRQPDRGCICAVRPVRAAASANG